jgi:hypothetical protein
MLAPNNTFLAWPIKRVPKHSTTSTWPFETSGADVLWMMFDPVEILLYASLGVGAATILMATWVLLRGR